MILIENDRLYHFFQIMEAIAFADADNVFFQLSATCHDSGACVIDKNHF